MYVFVLLASQQRLRVSGRVSGEANCLASHCLWLSCLCVYPLAHRGTYSQGWIGHSRVHATHTRLASFVSCMWLAVIDCNSPDQPCDLTSPACHFIHWKCYMRNMFVTCLSIPRVSFHSYSTIIINHNNYVCKTFYSSHIPYFLFNCYNKANTVISCNRPHQGL